MNSYFEREKCAENLFNICSMNSLFICKACVLRFLKIRKIIQFNNFEQLLEFYENIFIGKDLNRNAKDEFCPACLNMLNEQYVQRISNQIYDHIIKQLTNVGEIPQFQIHISLPMLLMIRHHYFAKLFEQTPEQIFTVKDILRTFLITKIETLLNAKNVTDSSNIIRKY